MTPVPPQRVYLGLCVGTACRSYSGRQDGVAQVVRFRSRHNPGRPNWARILYHGHEDDVFKPQPNLLCNFFHWIDNPEKRWPDKFWPCQQNGPVDGQADRSKVFYCSKAYYCNWTNNPFMLSRSWWHREYVVNFPKFKVRRAGVHCQWGAVLQCTIAAALRPHVPTALVWTEHQPI